MHQILRYSKKKARGKNPNDAQRKERAMNITYALPLTLLDALALSSF